MSTGSLQERLNDRADGALKRKIKDAAGKFQCQLSIPNNMMFDLPGGSRMTWQSLSGSIVEHIFEHKKEAARSLESELFLRGVDRMLDREAKT